MFLPPPLKSSAAMRAASTEPMPLVSWKMPEMSLSTPTRTTSPEICACAALAAKDSAVAAASAIFFMVSSPNTGVLSGRLDGDRQAFQATQRVVVATLHFARYLDRFHLARQRRHHDLAFEARHELADAHVDTGAIA